MFSTRTFGNYSKYRWYGLAEMRATAALTATSLGSLALLAAQKPKDAAMYALAMLLATRQLAAGFSNKEEYPLKGKTAVVTGCNTGIGYETALNMAKNGCKILFCCRSEERARAAMEKLRAAVPEADLIFVKCDLGDFKKASACADEIIGMVKDGRVGSIDYLVNNAGLFREADDLIDGVEVHVAVNHLAPLILTEKLLPYIVAAKGRIVNVASLAHNWFYLRKEEMPVTGYLTRLADKVKDGYRSPQYGLSKMLNIVYAKNLAHRLQGTGATACSLHPGAVMTEVFRDVKGMAAMFLSLSQYTTFKTPTEGAQTTLHCVYTRDLVSGGYYCDAEHRPDCLRMELTREDVEGVMKWSFDEAARVAGLPRPTY